MKKLFIIILLIISTNVVYANLQGIDYKKIPEYKRIRALIREVQNNEYMYKEYVHEWKFEKPKKQVIRTLQRVYNVLDKLHRKDLRNIELILLKGTIAHFLFNLDVQEYYQIAIQDFQKAMEIDEKDYRSYWFLGMHYSRAANQIDSMKYMLHSSTLKSHDIMSPYFWEDFAYAAYLAQMPSHAILGLDYSMEIAGKPSEIDTSIRDVINESRIVPKREGELSYEDLWTHQTSDGLSSYSNRAFGMRVSIEDDWDIKFSDYKNGGMGITVKPKSEIGYDNCTVTYSIAILTRIPDKDEKLQDFIDTLIGEYKNKKEVEFTSDYENSIAYEFVEQKYYKSQGGGHFFCIFLEREAPARKGLAIENPTNVLSENSGEVKYFEYRKTYTRFDGNIYYAILLDTCEAVYSKSFSVFKDFFKDKLVIE